MFWKVSGGFEVRTLMPTELKHTPTPTLVLPQSGRPLLKNLNFKTAHQERGQIWLAMGRKIIQKDANILKYLHLKKAPQKRGQIWQTMGRRINKPYINK